MGRLLGSRPIEDLDNADLKMTEAEPVSVDQVKWREKEQAMLSAAIVIFGLIAALRAVRAIPSLVILLLGTAVAGFLYLRFERTGRRIIEARDCARLPLGTAWKRSRREQRLLRKATRDALALTDFVTQHPRASARAIALASRVLRPLPQ